MNDEGNNESSLIKRLKELEQRRAEFAATVNHNLKTPLNGIIGFSSVILAEANNLEPEQIHQLRLVYDSARQLLDRIDALLILQRMESGKTKPSREWFIPEDLIVELASHSSGAANRNGINIQIELDSSPQKLLSDMNLVRRALQELVENSIRFGDQGICTMGVSVSSSEEHDSYMARFSVSNRGNVASEQKEDLVRSFNKQADYLETSFEGLGLGLALARQVALSLGGYLELDLSTQDITTFSLVLRLDKDEIELK